jgi:hypothetical protein
LTSESDLASNLARTLGPLYRVSVTNPDGAVLASFGRVEDGRTSDLIPIPNSDRCLIIEVDVRSLDTADRVLHDLAAPHQLAETPLGAFAHLEDALAQLIEQGEAHVGRPLKEMTRTEKQQLVRYLDERGAFSLRKAVERVAETLGVSRFTVYNYLDSVRTP